MGACPARAGAADDERVHRIVGLRSRRAAGRAPRDNALGALDELAAADPSIEVRPFDRYVDDGNIITSAGVSAGIDMALHLVVRLAGPERARQVRRGIQYDPAPPV